jgi:hypothetical protein
VAARVGGVKRHLDLTPVTTFGIDPLV